MTTYEGYGSHPEDAKPGLGNRGVERRLEPDREHPAGVERVDDPVVPDPGRREIRRALALVGLEDRRLEGIALPLGLELAADGGEDSGRLCAAHDRDARVGPRPQEPR